MFENFLDIESTEIVKVDGKDILALCGPIGQKFSEMSEVMVDSRKIVAKKDDLPTFIGQRVNIDGDQWEIEGSVIYGDVASVSFIRNLG